MLTKPTILLDPYLLMSLSAAVPVGVLSSCGKARFALCNHLPPEDFLPAEYAQIFQSAARENVELVSVAAIDMADLLYMRDVLVLHQVASIAAARSRRFLFASDCSIFRRLAGVALEPDCVLCGPDVRRHFSLN